MNLMFNPPLPGQNSQQVCRISPVSSKFLLSNTMILNDDKENVI